MSAVMEAVVSVLGSDTSKAEARAASVASQLDAAQAKVAKTERQLAEVNAALAAGSGDVEKLAAASVRLEEELRPLRRAVEGLAQAKAAADEAAVRVRARTEREALAAELGPLDAATASALRDVEKHLGPLSDALSRALASDLVAGRIRARLDLPHASTLYGDLSDVVRRLHVSLVQKHGDAHGRGVGSHAIEVPIFNAEVNASTARRLGIV